MPTSIKLAASDRVKLNELVAQANSRGDSVGAWADFYRFLARTIRNTVLPRGEAQVTAADVLILRAGGLLPKEQLDSMIWLMGGAGVNSAAGVFSKVIREYNIRQGELRGRVFSALDIQLASNEVGRRMAEQILAETPIGNGGYIPTVPEIGERDLNGVRDILYPGNNLVGSDMYLNQAWPGIVMLGAQGGNFTGRLLQTGSPASPAVLDTLGDLQNLFYSWESFRYAYDETNPLRDADVAAEFAIFLGIVNVRSINFSAEGFFKFLVESQDQVAKQALATILGAGGSRFIDMLYGVREAEARIGMTTDQNVAVRARDFFSQWSAAGLQAVTARLSTSSELRALARTDVNARAALRGLSLVLLDTKNPADPALALFDEGTGKGNLSARWIDDRAAMLGWLSKATTPINGGFVPPSTATGTATFKDVASGISFRVNPGEGVPDVTKPGGPATTTLDPILHDAQASMFVFGSKNSDSIFGGVNGDRLYGDAGGDTIDGGKGADWIEGGLGDDSLLGGDGASSDTLLGGGGDDVLFGGAGGDSLVGGADNDVLNGGSDNDFLAGGDGNDTYIFGTGWGADTVRDSDGTGKLQVVGYEGGLPVGIRKAPEADIYVSADKRVTYTLGPIGADGLRTVTITFKDAAGKDLSDRIVIEGWSTTKNLDITLDSATPPAVTDRVLTGDYAKQSSGGNYVLSSTFENPDWRSWDGHSYKPSGADPGAADVINGFSGSGDSMLGLGGSDALNGNDGDDMIDGGDGGDLLLGGRGSDSIYGGEGDDVIVGSNFESLRTPWLQEQFASVDLTVPAGSTLVSRGFSWVVYTTALPGASEGLLNIIGDGVTWRVSNEEDFDLALNATGKGNFIDAGAGNDHVLAGGGRDVVRGGDGNDHIEGLWDADYVEGGDGNDTIRGDGSTSEFIGATGLANSAWAPANLHGNDTLDGGLGNDHVLGQGGDDILFGGSGNDSLWGDEADLGMQPGSIQGNDYLDGGDGNDQLVGGGGQDQVFGGEGSDLLFGDSDKSDLPVDQHANDTVDGGVGDDYAEGGGGADLVLGGTGNDTLWGDAPTSKVKVSAHGNDTLDGGDGDDAVYGGAGDDVIMGGQGNDSIAGDGPSDDPIPAEQHAADWIDGGAGNDVVEAGGGADTVLGGDGDDTVYGQDGNDLLDGGSGSDRVDGGAGNDTLIGGSGTDALLGGDGDDIYVFSAGDSPMNEAGAAESIDDTVGTNRLVFADANLAALTVQAYRDGVVQLNLSSTERLMLTAGTAATISSFDFGRILPNTSSTSMRANVTLAAQPTSASLSSPSNGAYSLSELVGAFSATSAYLTGVGGAALAFGGKGNDTLSVATRGAQVSGGLGDDAVTISRAGFTFAYRTGDGFDRIKAKSSRPTSGAPAVQDRNAIEFGWGLVADGITLSVSGGNLVLTLDAFGSGINIDGFSATNALAGCSVDDFKFADGTSLTYSQLLARGFTMVGTDASEALTGTDIMDRYVASAGNDTLAGGAGSDVYEWGKSSGSDLVRDGVGSATDVDVLRLLDGLAPGDLRFIRYGNDLVVQRKETGAYVMVTDQFAGKGVEQIQFANGQNWDAAALQANLVSYGTPFNDEIVGDEQANFLEGFEGADTLRGGAGDDTLIGGQGDDLLLGGAGNDSYRFFDGDGSNGSMGTYEVLDDSEGRHRLEFKGASEGSISGTRFNDGRWQLRYGYNSTVTLTQSSISGVDSIAVDGAVLSLADFVARYSTMLTYVNSSGNSVLLGGASRSGFAITAAGTQVNVGRGDLSLEDQSSGGLTVRWIQGAGALTVNRAAVSGNDSVLKFGPGIGISSLQLAKLGDSAGVIANGQLALQLGDDQLLGTAPKPVFDFVEFSDGTRLTWDNLRAIYPRVEILPNDWATTASGTVTGDLAVGHAIARTWSLGAGNDLAVLGPSDDIFNMGTGSDEVAVAGGFGRDTVVFEDIAPGDVIKFGAGIGSSAVAYGRDGVDLNVVLKGSNDKLTIKDFFSYAGSSDVRMTELRFEYSGGDSTLGRNLSLSPLGELATGGDDVLWGGDATDFVDAGAGNDSINGMGGNDTLIGGAGDDTLEGGWGNDSLVGGEGNDFIAAIFDADTVVGGMGDDSIGGTSSATYRYELGDGHDTIQGGGKLLLGAGLDPQDVVFTQIDSDIRRGLKIEFQSKGGSVFLVDPQGYGPYQVVFQNGETWNHSYLVNVFTAVLGTNGSDALMGTPGADRMRGQQGQDTLTGLAGADELDGGRGADSMVGGADNDTYWVDDLGDVVVEGIGEGGKDIVKASIDYTMSANVEDGVLIGTANLSLTGNGLNNVLTGNVGNNVIDGGAGIDTMIGGAGSDTYVVDVPGDVITESASMGTDLVQTYVTWTLGANLENLTLLGAAIDGTGNSLANVIRGNASNNRLDGSAGIDTLLGGAGDDTYVVDNPADQVIELTGEGTDSVEASISFSLGDNIERLTLSGTASINGTGNTLGNTLAGNSGANRLDGAAGADTMIGGAGNDTYVVDSAGDVVTEAASGGTDTVEASIAYTLSAEVENLTLTGAVSINGTGNAVGNTLRGNVADNVLDGGAGSDTMIGGAGNDTYVVDAATDVVTENAGEGLDTIMTSVTLASLAANVESLTLTGSSALNATGNALANLLTGNAGANRLDGGAGADTMVGGAGNDTYVVDNASDVITELTSGGTDAVEASISYALGAEVENLTLTGTAADGTGNSLANTLTGNSSANRLNGGGGNDTMVGGAGNDTYVVDSTADVVTEAASGGTDTIETSVTLATLVAEVENLTLTGTANLNATGNSVANVLRGNSGDNILTGGAGNDTLIGGAGNDTYVLDVATDVVTENAGEGTDTIQIGVTLATLAANVENVTLTGTSNINATGNALANVLTGNSGANNLSGGDGDDTLIGGAGADTMVGGLGNDVFYVDATTDVVTEASGQGTDTIMSSVTLTAALASNVENVTLTGTSNLNALGNALANVMTGNSGANNLSGGDGDDTLDGGAGIDTLVGGLGNDVFYVDSTSDVVTEASGQGTDTIMTSVTLASLAANVENLTLTGTGNINGTGSSGDNVMTGNAGNNTLTGAAGNDTLDGKAGNDTLNGGAGADTYWFGLGYGSDLIVDSDATANVKDVVRFAAGIAQSDIRFTQSGNALVATIKSTNEALTIQDWYLSTNNRVEEFRFNDGTVLTNVQAQALVGAMAAFNPSGGVIAMVQEPEPHLRQHTGLAVSGTA